MSSGSGWLSGFGRGVTYDVMTEVGVLHCMNSHCVVANDTTPDIMITSGSGDSSFAMMSTFSLWKAWPRSSKSVFSEREGELRNGKV